MSRHILSGRWTDPYFLFGHISAASWLKMKITLFPDKCCNMTQVDNNIFRKLIIVFWSFIKLYKSWARVIVQWVFLGSTFLMSQSLPDSVIVSCNCHIRVKYSEFWTEPQALRRQKCGALLNWQTIKAKFAIGAQVFWALIYMHSQFLSIQ